MDKNDRLDCTIYVEPDISIGELSQFVADHLGGSCSGPEFGKTIAAPGCDIEVRRNPDHQDVAQGAKDGFLFFRNILEFYPSAEPQHSGMINLVGKILTSLWSRGWAAVAACDYEAELPSSGGYGRAPWSSIQVDFGQSPSEPRATA